MDVKNCAKIFPGDFPGRGLRQTGYDKIAISEKIQNVAIVTMEGQ